ncbi:MAG: T9SS type A sorting domain-containing protein, partial [Bacteroidales bacterium]|nr:T9SS type A sorting domain-containing protein [Bacteroidales bacterium]
EIQVFNTLGQLVKTIKGSNEINVGDLANGTYLLRVDDVFIKKVVVR